MNHSSGVLVASIVVIAGCGNAEQKRYGMVASNMEPTLHCGAPGHGCEAQQGDEIIAEPVEAGDLERGDIIVFETPPAARARCGAGGTFVMRIVGLPGERFELRSEGGLSFVYIGGEKLEEAYIETSRRDERGSETLQLPEDAYFVMGDNRRVSCDSREWGPVPAENIHHRAVAAERPSGRVDLR